jgi:uncharacterized protein YebE (UPF0316 family)
MIKELLANPWYAAIVVFITQIVFLYLRTLNVLYTSERNVWGAVWTGNGVSVSWLISMSIGLSSMVSGDWQPILAFLVGGTIGTYWGIRK